MCLRKCSSYVDCEAVNYKQPHLHCELLKDTRTIKLVDDIDFIHALKSNCITDNVCWPNPCKSRQKCITTSSGSAICVNHAEHLSDPESQLLIQERTLQNIATGKSASQYPSYLYGHWYQPADNAVDGNMTTISHTSTYNESVHADVYWMVDLAEEYFIHKIEIYNRADCCGYRFSDVKITVRVSEEPGMLCGKFVGPAEDGEHITIYCDRVILGRFVRLTLMHPFNDTYFHAREVEVYAYV